MPNDKPKAQPESKFAEVIRKGKEKRRGMQQQSETRAQAQEEAIQQEEANRVGQAFSDIKDSEI